MVVVAGTTVLVRSNGLRVGRCRLSSLGVPARNGQSNCMEGVGPANHHERQHERHEGSYPSRFRERSREEPARHVSKSGEEFLTGRQGAWNLTGLNSMSRLPRSR